MGVINLLGREVDLEYLRRANVEDLSRYTVEPRYPGPPVSEEALEALDLARKTLEWAKERLEEMGIKC